MHLQCILKRKYENKMYIFSRINHELLSSVVIKLVWQNHYNEAK